MEGSEVVLVPNVDQHSILVVDAARCEGEHWGVRIRLLVLLRNLLALGRQELECSLRRERFFSL